MNIIERAKAPTPKFFKVLRTVGLMVATTGATLLAAPITLPAMVITWGGYLTLAGSIITAISQITVDDDPNKTAPKKTDE